MNLTECPHCGARLPLVVDAFCPECRGELSAAPAGPAPAIGEHPPRPVAAPPPGLPLGRIFGALGLLAGVANGAAALVRTGGMGDGADHSLVSLSGYLFGSAASMGLIGLVFGFALGRFIRLVGVPKSQPPGSGKGGIQGG